jgi:DNA (cytosine-5)-methyltransferase 1
MPEIVPAEPSVQLSEAARLLNVIPLKVEEIAGKLGRNGTTIYRWRRGQTAPSFAELEMGVASEATRTSSGRPDFRFIDLFAGIGGLRLGVESVGGQCVFTCERDRFSKQTYEANCADGPDHAFASDITTVDPEQIPKHDLLLAGFPCQPFSIAGVSKKNALGRPHGFSLEQGPF